MQLYRSVVFSILMSLSSIALAKVLPAGHLLNLSNSELQEIGQKIYQNECGANPENLMHWNANESFASLGIGHFIWFSEQTNENDLRYEQQFPELVGFISHYQTLPAGLSWLKAKAPWNTKTEFLQFKRSNSSQILKQWLKATQSLQAQFIWQRFQNRLKHLKSQNAFKSAKVIQILQQMLSNPKTRFTLIDYVNFKGWGDNPKERYQNHGWGLLQVLETMARVDRPLENQDELLKQFIASAKQVLENRIKNAPTSKNEEAWRKGWFVRLNRYLK